MFSKNDLVTAFNYANLCVLLPPEGYGVTGQRSTCEDIAG
jgi:hypothetical protein